MVKQNKKVGFIDTRGTFIIPPVYDQALSFSNGLAPVKIATRWGFIDKAGNIIIKLKYDQVSTFQSNGIAEAQKSKGRYKIDRKGKILEKMADPEEEEKREHAQKKKNH